MIRVCGLDKKYNGQYLYKSFNLEIEENQITSIIGPSGCGKTTLLKILAGIEGYEKGKIVGLGNKKISFIFQEDRLIPWLSVSNNIKFVLKSQNEEKEVDTQIEEILRSLRLWEYKDYLPNQLSGGMQRRVAIGRAFAYPAEVLLMDEPFKGLDSRLKEEVIQSFYELWQREARTVICITHQLDEVKGISKHIIALEHKPVVCQKIK